jgi:hypothetical protein
MPNAARGPDGGRFESVAGHVIGINHAEEERMKVSNAEESRTDGPVRFAMHSIPGFGKTTLIAHFPRVVFLAHEDQNVPRDLPFKVKILSGFRDWEDVLDTVDSLTDDPHDYLTLAIDTVDWMEPLIHEYVCRRDSGRKTEMNPAQLELKSIEDYGFQKGYIVAEEEFRRLVWRLDILQARRGMHVAMAMHSHVKNFKNPGGSDYDRWIPKVHPRIAQVVVEWSETMLFGYFEANVSKEPDEKKKLGARAKGSSTGRRLLGTQWNAQFDAKNRIRLPAEVVLEHPSALVPYLLGEHLYPQQEDGPGLAADSRPAESSSTARPSDRRRPERPRAAPPANATPPADIPWQGLPQDGTGSQDRQREYEQQLRAAMPASRERTAPPPGAASTGDGKTDARTWTEPARPPAPEAPPRDRTADPRDAAPTPIALALERARALGAAYHEKVSEWAGDAGGDLVKLGKLIQKIDADIKQHGAAQQAR